MRPTPPLSTTASRIRPPVFAELQARIDKLTAQGGDLVPLHIGDTYLAPPEGARRAIGALDPDDTGLFRYGATAGLPELRAAMARSLATRGLDVDPASEILVGNGGTHALYCAARAVLDAGDEVLLASPYWPLAPGIFTACGAIPVEVPLTAPLYADPTADAGAMLAAKIGPRTKAIYLISPNNPDGKVLGRADLERIAKVAIDHDLWVFSDEVYADVVFDGEHVSIATLPGMRDRTIVLHSLSKSHALAGCRVGYVAAPEPVVASARRVEVHTAFNVSVAMQRAALAAIDDGAFPRSARDAYRSARDAAARALEGSGARFHLAEGGTYLFVDFADVLRGAPLVALLERAVDAGVLLAPGGAFGDAWSTCARLCYTAAPPDRVALGVARLREAIDAFQRTA